MEILYIANARMPTEKAHGIQIAKMCEAFIKEGATVTLVVPARTTTKLSLKEWYGLSTDVPVIRLPILNTYRLGSLGFIVGSLSFMLSSFLFVLSRKWRGSRAVIYTVDMDTFSSALLPLAGLPVYTEMHTGKPKHLFTKLFFTSLTGVIAVNRLLAEELQTLFGHSAVRYTVEPNGVDGTLFEPRDRTEARTHLGLPSDTQCAMYIGRFFAWKGLEILPDAARATSAIQWYLVGGTKEEFIQVTGMEPTESMHFVGDIPQAEVVWWMAAADALIVLGTARDTQSYRYTSPMKLFEYLLSERPIVASNTPAIREIVSEKEVFFYEPDSATDLAQTVERAMGSSEKSTAAQALGVRYSWKGRAERILAFLEGK